MSIFSKSGGIGVSFFFVLSGFLITYILVHEKLHKQSFGLRNFFIRRILRIWPLFYAMILFAFITPYILNFLNLPSSDDGYDPQWLVSMCFLENYKMMLTGSFPNISPLRVMWSLCVEEHFYIIWGLALYFIPVKKIPHIIIFSVLIANITRIIYHHIGINTLDVFSNIDYFALGAIPAYILLIKNQFLENIQGISLHIKYAILLITITTVLTLPTIHLVWLDIVSPTLLGILFSTVILFTLTEYGSLHISDDYLISKLGKYTYGLYLYHVIIINLLIQIANLLPFYNWIITGIGALLLTILTSIASYYLFERQFLKLKKFFS